MCECVCVRACCVAEQEAQTKSHHPRRQLPVIKSGESEQVGQEDGGERGGKTQTNWWTVTAGEPCEPWTHNHLEVHQDGRHSSPELLGLVRALWGSCTSRD